MSQPGRPAAVALVFMIFAAGGWVAVAPPEARGAADAEIIELAGHIPDNSEDWIYEPFEVPAGVTSISVVYDYDRKGGTNTLDIGIFAPDDVAPADSGRFRGWSGGFRDSFTLSEAAATPGYLPGPITPGIWHLILGPYRVHPQGLDWTATVTLGREPVGEKFVPTPAPQRLNKKAGWYRGDLHVHTVHSDGTYTPEEVVDHAVAAGLDFVVSAEHNTPSASLVWGAVADERLLVVNGEEVTTREGHYNAVGLKPGTWIDWRYRKGEPGLNRAVKKIRGEGALVMVNHPRVPQVDPGLAWEFGYGMADLLEVWNAGPWHYNGLIQTNEHALKDWVALLVKGRRVTAVGASDAHRSPTTHPGAFDQIGAPQTVVKAGSLSKKDIVAGVKRGRVYVAASRDHVLQLTAKRGKRKAGIGGTLRAKPRAMVTISLITRGLDGGVASLYTKGSDRQGRAVASAPISSAAQTLKWKMRAKKLPYLRVEVREPLGGAVPDPMLAFTNPIYVKRP